MRSEGYCSWVCVCVCVCLLSHISPMERLFVLKTLSRTQRATKVKRFVGFSLKPLRCRDPALPPFCGRAYSRSFLLLKARMRIIVWASPPALCFPVPAYIPLPPLASLPLPLAAQRNGGKRMCQSGLPADAASLRETGIVDRYTPPVGPCPIQ